MDQGKQHEERVPTQGDAELEDNRQEPQSVFDRDTWDRRSVSWLVGTGVGVYALIYVLAGRVPIDPEPFESTGQGFELLFLSALNGIQFEGVGDAQELALFGIIIAVVVAGPFLIVASYVLAARIGDGGIRRYATFGASIAVPFALTVAWRASQFEYTLVSREETLSLVGKPLSALFSAALLALICGAIGGLLAGWRRT
ncbi:hypothetical protein [Natrinema sp. HArc-T2]|uniref:hypothetical protein n=1 Tax=Natrinema sp. HArc-T2 TaxID=3242701 RepID=UPI00359D3357